MSGTTSAVLNEKLRQVEKSISQLGSVLVAFSGGVDSSLLLALSVRALGSDRVLAVTDLGPLTPEEDARFAREVAQLTGAAHRVIVSDPLEVPGFAANDPERCYVCKRDLFATLERIRVEEGLAAIAYGSIADDADDYRPGSRAAAEAGVVGPLAEARMTKAEVREASRQLALPTAERPSSPCLASRFPYGETITSAALQMVARAEGLLRGRGFPVVRVRHHGRLARIEVPAEKVSLLTDEPLRTEIALALRDLGYAYVTVDLQGFRSGSLNEVL